MEGNKVPSDWANGLELHFLALLKEWRLNQQKKHGERVEVRQKVNNTPLAWDFAEFEKRVLALGIE
jgi:hypothetical protein